MGVAASEVGVGVVGITGYDGGHLLDEGFEVGGGGFWGHGLDGFGGVLGEGFEDVFAEAETFFIGGE